MRGRAFHQELNKEVVRFSARPCRRWFLAFCLCVFCLACAFCLCVFRTGCAVSIMCILAVCLTVRFSHGQGTGRAVYPDDFIFSMGINTSFLGFWWIFWHFSNSRPSCLPPWKDCNFGDCSTGFETKFIFLFNLVYDFHRYYVFFGWSCDYV